MKIHTQDFKSKVKDLGRELDSVVTYGQTELREELYSVSRNIDGNILKSVMKELIIESSVDIPINEIINYKIGILINGEYEYLDYGNYVVYSSEKEEDKDIYKITCYDKMLYAMKEYENSDITYPVTIRHYIKVICDKLNLTFVNEDSTFANYDKEIPTELYMNYNSDTQTYSPKGYTFRDVLDQLSEVTASTICINDNDELEIRYINNTLDEIDEEYFKDINVNFA